MVDRNRAVVDRFGAVGGMRGGRDAEQEGALVTAADSAWLSTVAALNGEPFVAWVDNRNAPPSFGSVYAQRLAP